MKREHAYKLRELLHKASISLSDEDALDGIELFPAWAGGVEYAEGKRLRYTDKLYKVKQAHTSQADWTPNIATSLYEVVEEAGKGDTPDDPIPYDGNMKLVEGKYYSQSGVTYHCTRSTGIPVYNALADLVGIYVEVVA